jgi:hypothetical protein
MYSISHLVEQWTYNHVWWHFRSCSLWVFLSAFLQKLLKLLHLTITKVEATIGKSDLFLHYIKALKMDSINT